MLSINHRTFKNAKHEKEEKQGKWRYTYSTSKW